MEALQAWIRHARPMGSFCSAVVRNDLLEACARADEHNRAALFEIVAWMYWNAPPASWSYQDALEKWPQILKRRCHEHK